MKPGSRSEALYDALTEKQWQTVVTDYATLCGWEWFHNPDSRRVNAGLPDLLLVREGEALFVELKKHKGKVTRKQQHILGLLDSAGIESHIWWPNDWPTVTERLR